MCKKQTLHKAETTAIVVIDPVPAVILAIRVAGKKYFRGRVFEQSKQGRGSGDAS